MIPYASPLVAYHGFCWLTVGFFPRKGPEGAPDLDITGRLVDRSRQLLKQDGFMVSQPTPM